MSFKRTHLFLLVEDELNGDSGTELTVLVLGILEKCGRAATVTDSTRRVTTEEAVACFKERVRCSAISVLI